MKTIKNFFNQYIIIQLINSLFRKYYININNIINILSLIYIGILFYYFMLMFEINLFKMFQIFLFSIFSFALFFYISDNFKYSNNKFIKFIQKFVIFNSIFVLIVLIGLILYLSVFNNLTYLNLF